MEILTDTQLLSLIDTCEGILARRDNPTDRRKPGARSFIHLVRMKLADALIELDRRTR